MQVKTVRADRIQRAANELRCDSQDVRCKSWRMRATVDVTSIGCVQLLRGEILMPTLTERRTYWLTSFPADWLREWAVLPACQCQVYLSKESKHSRPVSRLQVHTRRGIDMPSSSQLVQGLNIMFIRRKEPSRFNQARLEWQHLLHIFNSMSRKLFLSDSDESTKLMMQSSIHFALFQF